MGPPTWAGVALSFIGSSATGQVPILVPVTSVSHRSAASCGSLSQRSSAVWQTPAGTPAACSRAVASAASWPAVHAPTAASSASWWARRDSSVAKRGSDSQACCPATAASASHSAWSKQATVTHRSRPAQRKAPCGAAFL